MARVKYLVLAGSVDEAFRCMHSRVKYEIVDRGVLTKGIKGKL